MSTTTRHGTVERTRHHEAWVDNLRVILIAGVVVVHTATAYVIDIPWYYDDERTASFMWSVIFGFPTFAGGAFGVGPLFMVAGWFSVRSLARRGPGAFARARLLRLGVPLLAYILVVQPLSDYMGNLRSERGSVLYYLGITEVGVMWFVAALLACSLGYAWLRHRRPAVESGWADRPGVVLFAAAATIAVSCLLVWQVWPWNAEVVLNMRFGEWPQGVVLFALGVHAAERGWLDYLTPELIRRIGWLAAAAAAILGALFGAVIVWADVDVLLQATVLWPTVLFAMLDGLLAVTWTVWCVAWFRRRWSSHGPLMDKAGRASYATYFIHPLALTSLMVLFAVVPLAAPLKFVVVAALAVPVCYAAGYGLTQVPGLSRVF
jgi:peptidoglycan/LPS O-acetylase OafA/YrhL